MKSNLYDRYHSTVPIGACSAQVQKHPPPDTTPSTFENAHINTINQLKLKLKTTQKRNRTLVKENQNLQNEVLKLQQHIRMLVVKRTNENQTIMKLQTKLAKKERATYKLNRTKTSETSIQCQIVSLFHIETFQSLLKAEREKNDLLTETIQHDKILSDKETSDRDSKEDDFESDISHDYNKEDDFKSDISHEYKEHTHKYELNIEKCQPETSASNKQYKNPEDQCENANWHESTQLKEKYQQRLGLNQAKASTFLNYLWKSSNQLIATILKNQ